MESEYRIVKLIYDNGSSRFAIQKRCKIFKNLWKYYDDTGWYFSKDFAMTYGSYYLAKEEISRLKKACAKIIDVKTKW